MLTNFQVESFRSLEDVTVELGHVNVFVGASGSGKSNLLQAIGFDAASSRADYTVELNNPSAHPEPEWRFATERLDEISEGGRQSIVDRSKPGLHLKPEAGYAALKFVVLEAGMPTSTLLSELQQYAIYAPYTATLGGLHADPQNRLPVGLTGGRLAETVETILDPPHSFDPAFVQWDKAKRSITALIGWPEGIGSAGPAAEAVSKNISQPTHSASFWDRYRAEDRNVLSGYDASEGALYVLFMAVLCLHPDVPPVLAVDTSTTH